jgi:hypothetical protein
MGVNASELNRRVGLFEEQVMFWQQTLGLTDVEINLAPKHPEADTDARASWYGDIDGRIISIFYSLSWLREDDGYIAPVTDREIDKVAFHEVFECQFFRIHEALLRSVSDRLSNELMHEIVRRAENTIFPAMRPKG